MFLSKYLLTTIFFLLALPAGAQKFEQELRIKVEEVPAHAQNFVDSRVFDKKVNPLQADRSG